MSEYIRHKWSDDEVIDANKLNNIETGIAEAKKETEQNKTELEKLTDQVNNSVASWNDIPDKPFGEATGMVEILPECQPQEDADWGLVLYGAVDVSIGDTCTVNWNGTEYTCVAQGWDMVGAGVLFPVLGDLYTASEGTAGTAATGEPFVLVVIPGVSNEEIGVMVMPIDGATSVTLSISKDGTIVTPLPTKYLPDGVPYCIDGGMVEVLAECQLTYGEDEDAFFLLDHIDIVEGKTYSVQWNGVEYTCVAQASETDGVTVVVLGNMGMIDESATNTGEPFVVIAVPAEQVAEMGMGAIIYALDGTTELTLAIYGDGTEIRKLDNRCLDLAWLPTVKPAPDQLLFGEQASTGLTIDFGPAWRDGLTADNIKALCLVIDGVEHYVTPFVTTPTKDGVIYSATVTGCSVRFGWTTGITADDFAQATFADGGTHDIWCYTVTEAPNKMPIEFLPDLAWLPVFEGETVLDCTAVVSVADSPATIPALSTTLERETEVDVYINGVHYDGVRSHDSDGEYISAVGSVSGVVGFDIKRFDDKYLIGVGSSSAFFLSSVAGTYTVKVTLKATPNKMPEEFLPESVDGVIIRSSTEGSTKKFKLTVDDSGTITATEVTA